MFDKMIEEVAKSFSGKFADRVLAKNSPQDMLDALEKLRTELKEIAPDQAKIDILTTILWGVPTHQELAKILLAPENYSNSLVKNYVNAAPAIEWDVAGHQVKHTRKAWMRVVEKWVIIPLSIIQLILIVSLAIGLYMLHQSKPLATSEGMIFLGLLGLIIFFVFFNMFQDAVRVVSAESFEKKLKALPSLQAKAAEPMVESTPSALPAANA